MSLSTHLFEGKKVAIIGAGPGGLVLAGLLEKQGVAVHVYERDASPTARPQGAGLGLDTETGQRALERLGLLPAFIAQARAEGQGFTMINPALKVLVNAPPKEGEENRPEIERGALRDLLLDAVSADTVKWGYELERVEEHTGDSYHLIFKNGETVTTDILIGCDGIKSRVRPILTDIKMAYTGVTTIESRIAKPDTAHPLISNLIGQGAVLCVDEGRTIWTQRLSDGSMVIYYGLRVPETWIRELDFTQPAHVREVLLSKYDGWSQELLAYMQDSQDVFRPWPLYTFPANQTWETKEGVTILGDAAHVMPPFTGAGANLAMLDAMELADALVSSEHESLFAAISTYEKGMLARSKAETERVLSQQEQSFSPKKW